MSIWDDIADDAAEAENLKLRAALIRAIRSRVEEIGWSQTAAAENLGITQPRLSDLYRGKISKFSLDALVEIASKLGIHVRIEVPPRERGEPGGNRMDDRRAPLTRLQKELPKRTEELRGKLTTEELRKAAEEFLADATETYNTLVERGEAALERLKGQPEFKEAADRVEGYVEQAVELTQEALGNVSAQTRAVGERAAMLVGVELTQDALGNLSAQSCAELVGVELPLAKAPGKNATPAKAAAKKAPAKKVTLK